MMANPFAEELQRRGLGSNPFEGEIARRAFEAGEVDTESGAPAGVRALVGGAPTPDARLSTLRQFYPNAYPHPNDPENYIFKNPTTNRWQLYNPPGYDFPGDPASVAREGAQAVGGTLGAGLGAVAGPVGSVAGAGLGTAAGEETFNLLAQRFGMADPRSLGERSLDAATLTATGGAGQAAGSALTAAGSAAVRGAMRGAKTGRQSMQEMIDAFRTAGATPTVGQATGGRIARWAENRLAAVPGADDIIAGHAERVNREIERNVTARAQALADGRVDPESAGRVLQSGIEGKVGRFKQTAGDLFDRVDALIPPDTAMPLPNTIRLLDEMQGGLEAVPELSRALQSPGLRSIAEAFKADVGETGALPYDVVKRLRTVVGEKLATPSLVDDVPRGQWKRIYGALSEDMKALAAERGEGAARAFERANTYYNAGIKRIDDVLETLAKKVEPEAAFRALEQGGKDGASRLRAVRRSLEPEEFRVLSGTMLQRLGRPTPGRESAETTFSTERFLTNWNRLDDRAKNAWFGGKAMGGLRQDLDRITVALSSIRDAGRAGANPSGTAQGVVGSGLLMGGAASALSGSADWLIGLVKLMGTMRGSAMLMTSPKFVNWLARSTEIKPNGIGAHLGRLSGIAANEDPTTRRAVQEFLLTLRDTTQQTSAQQTPRDKVFTPAALGRHLAR